MSAQSEHQSTGRAAPWPPPIRERLAGGGLVAE
jgi:hypothetical protein